MSNRCVAEITVLYRGSRASALQYAFRNPDAVQASLDLYYQECQNDLEALGFPNTVFQVTTPTTLDFDIKLTQMKVIWGSLLTNTRRYHHIRYLVRNAMDVSRSSVRESRSICGMLYHENAKLVPLTLLPREFHPRQDTSSVSDSAATQSSPSTARSLSSGSLKNTLKVPPSEPRAMASSSSQDDSTLPALPKRSKLTNDTSSRLPSWSTPPPPYALSYAQLEPITSSTPPYYAASLAPGTAWYSSTNGYHFPPPVSTTPAIASFKRRVPPPTRWTNLSPSSFAVAESALPSTSTLSTSISSRSNTSGVQTTSSRFATTSTASVLPSALPLAESSNNSVARNSSATTRELKRKREADTSSADLASSSQNTPIASVDTNGAFATKRVRLVSSTHTKGADASSSTSTQAHALASLRASLASEKAERIKAEVELTRLRREHEALRKEHEASAKCGTGGHTCPQVARMQNLLETQRDLYSKASADRAEEHEAYEKLTDAMDAIKEEKAGLESAVRDLTARIKRDAIRIATTEERLALLRAENDQLVQSLKEETESHLLTRNSIRELGDKLEYEKEAKEIYRMDAVEAHSRNQRLAEDHRQEMCHTAEEKESLVAALDREGDRSLCVERALADYKREVAEPLIVPALLKAFDMIANLSTDAMYQAPI
ncbi:hypothetical protein EIP91_011491 [Steccherinum ochraceum]|uniref:Uncharacterized protein n=1 Tax=Steccherinum ochraceum TaxID=92696 RepID=A0A4R0RKP8_9APHY|nr:hypothetical protein EIP91_011491 [Steccherinum ochraceum]